MSQNCECCKPEIPNLQIGVETKRNMLYQGKQVYSQLINFGALPNKTTKTVPHNIKNVEWIAMDYNHSTVRTSSGTYYGPEHAHPQGVSLTWGYSVDAASITIVTGYDRRTSIGTLCLQYTKTTDPVIS